ncbi:MAG: 5-guanidino-2-oxopentanoate decarboxylase [Acidiferrobacterales bacterium]|nr:5-guanidino-2-oxopentanoate decarboxylase [Acidiferrobacterales bacterium]
MTMARTCGQELMRLLARYGISVVFGIPGEHTLELYRGIQGSGIRSVTPRNEQGASFMADGYARVTGRPGVCTLITGPGVTNAATGIGQAFADSIPMLVISSANDSPSLGKGWGRLHETTDLCAITRPLTAFSAMVHNPDELPDLIARAFTVFDSERPRPVHIAIPIDVMEMPVEDDWQVCVRSDRPVPTAQAVQSAAALLTTAVRPIIVVGGGAQHASEEVTSLSSLLGAGVIASNAGKGIVPDSNQLSLGGGIISPAVQRYLGTADVVLAIGTELAEADSFIYDLPVNGKVIRIDIDSSRFNDAFPASVAVHGDSKAACQMLIADLQENSFTGSSRDILAELEQVRAEQHREYTEVEQQHVKLLSAMRSVLPDDSVIMGDIAQIVYTGTAAMKVEQPRSWFYPAGFGTLGCAVPGAIGAKLAVPNQPVVALVGDGGFMFTVNEVATAVEESLCIPIIIWHNHSYAMIRDGMVKRGIPEIGVNPKAPDFIKLAEAFGCPGKTVHSRDSFVCALDEALRHQGPSIIVVLEDDDWLTSQ